MSHQPTTRAKNEHEAVEDAIMESGSEAKILGIDWEERVIRVKGDYADVLLFRRAVKRFEFEVESE